MPTKGRPSRTPLPKLIARRDTQGNEDEESRHIEESKGTRRSSDLSSPTMANTSPKSPVEYLEPNDDGSLDNNENVNSGLGPACSNGINGVKDDSQRGPSPSCNGPSSKRKRSPATTTHTEPGWKNFFPSEYDQKATSPQTETKTLFALHPSKTKGMKLLPHPLLQGLSESGAKRRTTASSSTPEKPPPRKRRKRSRPG
ncbi:hypothetical protein FHL15_003842 [Xylaria flabelliformis]|uniref:Uncharacterized protein n=1 Tax=Xylaria flabelliformis TaxID=2512241 RepID=A0A553I4L9_9PEZI|nr:hypothetical protein FHL15_003842 [Xylaria flabelliformis]